MLIVDNLAPAAACAEFAGSIRRQLLVTAAVVAIAVSPPVGSGAFAVDFPETLSAPSASAVFTARARFAKFGAETPSPDARHLADWIADSGDNAGGSFVIVDKTYAKLYVFDGNAHLRGVSSVLLGAALGDDSVPGIGSRSIAEVRPEERTTPAGRFVAERGRNLSGEDVVWVDYDAAVSMHRVRSANPGERRLERLATPTVDDNRISYGCINVPVVFYEAHIRPIFVAHRAIVYVMPEIASVRQVFGSYDVAVAHGIGQLRAAD